MILKGITSSGANFGLDLQLLSFHIVVKGNDYIRKMNYSFSMFHKRSDGMVKNCSSLHSVALECEKYPLAKKIVLDIFVQVLFLSHLFFLFFKWDGSLFSILPCGRDMINAS